MGSDWLTTAAGLVGALIGGVVTGVFALVAVRWTHRNDLERQEKKEAAQLHGFYRAVLVEVETLWSGYSQDMGQLVESLQSGQPLAYYYPITQDYFTVYRNNAEIIGRIPRTNLREILVKTYVEAQMLVDSFKLNNEMVARLEHWEGLFGETENKTYQTKIKSTYAGLVDYATQIQKRHSRLKANVEALIGALKDDIEQK